jgi:multimeric flavodoxin WrbA
MKKVFGFIGSPLKTRSNTYTVAKMMTDRLQEMDSGISCELLTAGDVKIDYCRGCWSCMTRGVCPQDKTDGMAMLKQKMIEADFIIWGSPVYTMQVSGQMKTFLDRLCCWYHLMFLAGRSGIVLSTTAGSGTREVNDFLGMLLCAIGVKVVGDIEARGYFPATLGDPEDARQKAHAMAGNVLPYVLGEKPVESDDYLEQCFQVAKKKVTYGAKWLPADVEYWQKKGMDGLNSFAELLEKIRAGKGE